jgi:hypothetical protein
MNMEDTMIREEIWLRVIAPVAISTLEALAAAAPKGTCIRNGGSVVINGQTCKVLEFVVPPEK